MQEAIHTLEPKTRLRTQRLRKEASFAIGSTALIWQALFFYIPLGMMMLSSLFHLSEAGSIEGLTLEHFKEVLHTAYFAIIGNSFRMAFITTFVCLLIGFPVAHFIATTGRRFKTLLLFLIILPFWTNFLLHVCAWQFVLEHEGFLNNFLLSIGLISEPLRLLNTPFAVHLMMIYYFLPFMILPIFSSLEKFNYDLVDASLDLGASPWRTFTKVMLPLTLPAIRAGFFLVFIPSFGEFVIPELMGGDKRYFVGNVVSQYVLGSYTQPLGAAFTVLSCICLLSVIAFCNWAIKKTVSYLRTS